LTHRSCTTSSSSSEVGRRSGQAAPTTAGGVLMKLARHSIYKALLVCSTNVVGRQSGDMYALPCCESCMPRAVQGELQRLLSGMQVLPCCRMLPLHVAGAPWCSRPPKTLPAAAGTLQEKSIGQVNSMT
jgi:hypothetical protein